MIRSHSPAPHSSARRRIAVMELPAVQRARLGSIANADPALWPPPQLASRGPVANVPVHNQVPSNADYWQAFVLQRQAQARETTPGSLVHAPAAGGHYAPPIQAHWNSWGGANCEATGIPDEMTDAAPVSPAANVAAMAVQAAQSSSPAAFAGSYMGSADFGPPAAEPSKLWTMAAVLGAAASLAILAQYRRR